jgi:hypothetical protein
MVRAESAASSGASLGLSRCDGRRISANGRTITAFSRSESGHRRTWRLGRFAIITASPAIDPSISPVAQFFEFPIAELRKT